MHVLAGIPRAVNSKGSSLAEPPDPRNPFPKLPALLPLSAGPQPWSFTTQMDLQGEEIWVLQTHLRLDRHAVGFRKNCRLSKLS